MSQSITDPLDPNVVRHVAGTCLCLHVQRAARALARHFDQVFRPVGLSNGQFSLLMALNQPTPPTIGALATFLAMDRTSLTAMLKPLQRKGLVCVTPDPTDRRSRQVSITDSGVVLLRRALTLWETAHTALSNASGDDTPPRLRRDLAQVRMLAAGASPEAAAQMPGDAAQPSARLNLS